MVDLFADIPRETVENTLQTIRENLDQVGLYGGHTLHRHADIQPLALKTRLATEDIRYATSYWDREVADAVVKGIMKSFFDPGITTWLRYGGGGGLLLGRGFFRAGLFYTSLPAAEKKGGGVRGGAGVSKKKKQHIESAEGTETCDRE